jgi:hypothetical protein
MTHELWLGTAHLRNLSPHPPGPLRTHIRSTEALAMVAGPCTVCVPDGLPFRKANHGAMKAVTRTVAKIKVERE